jgi:hypothetical protein
MQAQTINALGAIAVFSGFAGAVVMGLFLGFARPAFRPWGLDRIDYGCLLGALLLIVGCINAAMDLEFPTSIGMLVGTYGLIIITYIRTRRFAALG